MRNGALGCDCALAEVIGTRGVDKDVVWGEVLRDCLEMDSSSCWDNGQKWLAQVVDDDESAQRALTLQ